MTYYVCINVLSVVSRMTTPNWTFLSLISINHTILDKTKLHIPLNKTASTKKLNGFKAWKRRKKTELLSIGRASNKKKRESD